MASTETRSLMSTAPRGLALVILLGLAFPAMASAGSPTLPNSCDSNSQLLSRQAQVVQYAKTGQSPSDWKPDHSRAWFMAALGMRDSLQSYLENDRHLLEFSDLLTAATYTNQKSVVVMLLQMGENPNRNGSDTWALPLEIAANCGRGTIMVYLLSAGADVYGVSQKSNVNAMGAAIIPIHSFFNPFVEGVRLLLAAGFDPRCPVTSRGASAVDLVSGWRADPQDQDKTWLDVKDLIETAAKIASVKNPGEPRCGESGHRFRKN